MKKLIKILNIIRYIILIIELFLLFSLISSFINLGGVSILFILSLLIYMIINIKDFLIKRSINKDLVYIFMNITLFIYISLFWFRVYINNISNIEFLKENYSFLTLAFSILIIYNLFYERLYNK